MSDVTVPRYMTAYCTECGYGRTFELVAGSYNDLLAEYECDECGHRVELRLSP